MYSHAVHTYLHTLICRLLVSPSPLPHTQNDPHLPQSPRGRPNATPNFSWLALFCVETSSLSHVTAAVGFSGFQREDLPTYRTRAGIHARAHESLGMAETDGRLLRILAALPNRGARLVRLKSHCVVADSPIREFSCSSVGFLFFITP
jgi:hypothetical protein